MEQKFNRTLVIILGLVVVMCIALSMSLRTQRNVNKQQEVLIEKAINQAYYDGAYDNMICQEENYWNRDIAYCRELEDRE